MFFSDVRTGVKEAVPNDMWHLSDAATFPQKLYALSVREFWSGDDSIVEWCAGGTAFRVTDMEAFEQDVLPCYFEGNVDFPHT
jgi:hypothetical protein